MVFAVLLLILNDLVGRFDSAKYRHLNIHQDHIVLILHTQFHCLFSIDSQCNIHSETIEDTFYQFLIDLVIFGYKDMQVFKYTVLRICFRFGCCRYLLLMHDFQCLECLGHVKRLIENPVDTIDYLFQPLFLFCRCHQHDLAAALKILLKFSRPLVVCMVYKENIRKPFTLKNEFFVIEIEFCSCKGNIRFKVLPDAASRIFSIIKQSHTESYHIDSISWRGVFPFLKYQGKEESRAFSLVTYNIELSPHE